MNKLLIVIFLCFTTLSAFAQFLPGEVGYNFEVKKLYAENKISKAFEIVVAVDKSDAQIGDTTDFFSYSELGLLRQHVFYDNPEPGKNITLDYMYNANGVVSTISNMGFEDVPFLVSYEYDKENKMIGSSIKGEEPRRDSYEYNIKGNIIQRTGEVFIQMTDSNGINTGAKQWIAVDKDKYIWNEDETLFSDSFYANNKLYAYVTFEYNEYKQLIYIRYYADDEKIQSGGSTMFIYNDVGLPVVKIEYNAYGDKMEQLKYAYEMY